MKEIDILDVKRIAVWNPQVTIWSTTNFAAVLLLQEDEIALTIEFPNREALAAFLAQLARKGGVQ